MDHPQRAVFFLEEDASVPAHSKPLMLEAVLFCPILRWMSEKLLADGVQRFFVVCGPRFAEEARACLPESTQVIVSEQQRELLERCLAHLPQREIDLLNYYYILELPYKEIARLTGLTAENARTIVCRAKKKVLAAYREKGGKADE